MVAAVEVEVEVEEDMMDTSENGLKCFLEMHTGSEDLGRGVVGIVIVALNCFSRPGIPCGLLYDTTVSDEQL